MKSRVFAVSLALASALSFAAPISGASRAASPTGANWSGRWGYIVETACTPNASLDPKGICQQLDGPHGGSFSNWLDAVAKPNGKLTFKAGFVATEDDPQAAHYCSYRIFSHDFNGSCLVTDHGHGFIKPDSKGNPYLWISGETATFHGKYVTTKHDPGPHYPFQNQEIVPGVYNTSESLRMAGLVDAGDAAPANVFFNTTVTHYR